MAVTASIFIAKSAISVRLDFSSTRVKLSCLKRPVSASKPLVVRSVALSPPARTAESPPAGYGKNVGICLVSPCRKIFIASKIHVPDTWQMPQVLGRRVSLFFLVFANSSIVLCIQILKVEERNQGRSEGHGDSTSPKYYQFVSDGNYEDAGLPSSSRMEVPHVHQLASWDCGLACVLMVLRASGITSCTIEDLAEICSTNSIWTVDLAYLLQKFCVEFSYFTITFGANPNYSIEEFYKEQLPEDLVRVDLLFRKAHESGVIIQCRSVSIHEISCLLLSGNYIAIALVDQDKLSKSWLEEVIVAGLHNSNSSYTGHYIVICGYDAVRDEFEIRDPASSKRHERISSKCLEKAWKSFGTDEDLLLINLENTRIQE